MKEAPLNNRLQCRQNSFVLEEDAMQDSAQLERKSQFLLPSFKGQADLLVRGQCGWRLPVEASAHLPSRRVRLNPFSLCSMNGTVKFG